MPGDTQHNSFLEQIDVKKNSKEAVAMRSDFQIFDDASTIKGRQEILKHKEPGNIDTGLLQIKDSVVVNGKIYEVQLNCSKKGESGEVYFLRITNPDGDVLDYIQNIWNLDDGSTRLSTVISAFNEKFELNYNAKLSPDGRCPVGQDLETVSGAQYIFTKTGKSGNFNAEGVKILQNLVTQIVGAVKKKQIEP